MGKNMRLNNNKSKSKYMAAGKAWKKNMAPTVTIRNHIFEKVE